jgi:hypothetical protein
LKEAFSQQAALEVSNATGYRGIALARYQTKNRERLWAAEGAGEMYLQALLEAKAQLLEADTQGERKQLGISPALSPWAGRLRDIPEDADILASGMPLWVILLGHLPSAKAQEKILSFFEKEGEACRPWLEEAILLILEEAGVAKAAWERRPSQEREARLGRRQQVLLRRLWQSVKSSATSRSVEASKDWQLAAYFAAMGVCKLSPAAQSHLLVAALSAEASALRLAAWEAIFYTPQLLSSLEGALQRDVKGDWRMRLVVARLLGYAPRVSPSRKRLLQRLMRDPHPWVRIAATTSWAQQPKRPYR